MLQSMTGFGKKKLSYKNKSYTVEIKSLNGKQFELQLKNPIALKPLEIEIKNLISSKLLRGSVDCNISIVDNGRASPVKLNAKLVRRYLEEIKKISSELDISYDGILNTILKMPDVVTPSEEELEDEEWLSLKKLLLSAMKDLEQHRIAEGKILESDILTRVGKLKTATRIISTQEGERKKMVKEKLLKNLNENLAKNEYDEQRLHQELIYYIEKMDITEERVRLNNHCDYFITLVNEKEKLKGKKLNFILQEMGREINTIGSKSYNADIQKTIINMKDELEKIKEQIMNIL